MPSKKQAKGAFVAADLAHKARHNPYVQRLIEDPKLRQDMLNALESGKSAYARLHNGKVVHKVLLEDKKLRADVQDAVVALREASARLTDAPKPKRKRRLGRRLLILFAGAALALALSEGLRSKVLDALFGAEEEFQYTPPPPAPATPPASPVSAA
jgi:hypothetical protein